MYNSQTKLLLELKPAAAESQLAAEAAGGWPAAQRAEDKTLAAVARPRSSSAPAAPRKPPGHGGSETKKKKKKKRAADDDDAVTRRMGALPSIVCRAANGDLYLLSMDQVQRPRAVTPPPPPPLAAKSAAAAAAGKSVMGLLAAKGFGRRLRERHTHDLQAARTRAAELQKAAAKRRAVEALSVRNAKSHADSLPQESHWQRVQQEYLRGSLLLPEPPAGERPTTAEARVRAILAAHADHAPCNAVRAEVWDVVSYGGQGRGAAMLTMDLGRDAHDEREPQADGAAAEGAERAESAEGVYLRACEQCQVVVLSTVLKEMRKRVANMDHLYLKHRGTQALSAALPANTAMHTLRLRGNAIDAAACSLLVAGLARNGTLRCLDLSNNNLGDAGATNLAALVSAKVTAHQTLEELVLNQCDISDAGVAALAAALAEGGGNATLATLRLRNNCLMDGAAAELAQLLRCCKKCALTELDLSWNRLGPAGAVALGAALRADCPLRALHVEWNGTPQGGSVSPPSSACVVQMCRTHGDGSCVGL